MLRLALALVAALVSTAMLVVVLWPSGDDPTSQDAWPEDALAGVDDVTLSVYGVAILDESPDQDATVAPDKQFERELEWGATITAARLVLAEIAADSATPRDPEVRLAWAVRLDFTGYEQPFSTTLIRRWDPLAITLVFVDAENGEWLRLVQFRPPPKQA